MKKRKTVTICSSISFYKAVLMIEKQLQNMGYAVHIPEGAKVMENTGNFEVMDYKPWYRNKDDYTQKKQLMEMHFTKIKKSDAILVVNNTKDEIDGYIGGNVLMEMTVAYILKKDIFILHTISEALSFKEEIYGMFPTFLQGNLEMIYAKELI